MKITWMQRLFHLHDYEMEFDDPKSLVYTLRCRCGDAVGSTNEALWRMRRPFLVICGTCVIMLLLLLPALLTAPMVVTP